MRIKHKRPGAAGEAAERFSLGRQRQSGRFERQASRFRDWVSADGSTAYPAEAGRYHLYVSWACPWAHRTIIGRLLKGLEQAIPLWVVDPIRDGRGWAFTGDCYVDGENGWEYLSEAYRATESECEDRVSVPVLWDSEARCIVSNESSDILHMLDSGFGDLAKGEVMLYPETFAAELEALDQRVYDSLNNAVYRAGFTTRQGVYERVVCDMFALLDELDERLGERRFLFGEEPLASDWRLFTSLVRFDAVYYIHFKCCLRRIAEYPNLWPYLRDLYQQPGIAETVRFDEIRKHYYRTHPEVNPSGVMALQPRGDFSAPHGRERLATPRAA